MVSTPRNTALLISRTVEDLTKIQAPSEFWERLHQTRFADRYYEALLAAGMPEGKADETAAMVRQYIARISAGLEQATYLLKELASEVDEARRRAGVQLNEGGFRV